jgi:hypothetical protein
VPGHELPCRLDEIVLWPFLNFNGEFYVLSAIRYPPQTTNPQVAFCYVFCVFGAAIDRTQN